MQEILDLNNLNIGKANPHDGTRGFWSIIPADGKILLHDQVNNKVYELSMTEITPNEFINNGGDVNLNKGNL